MVGHSRWDELVSGEGPWGKGKWIPQVVRNPTVQLPCSGEQRLGRYGEMMFTPFSVVVCIVSVLYNRLSVIVIHRLWYTHSDVPHI